MARRGYVHRRSDAPGWHYDFSINGRRFRGSTRADTKDQAEIIVAKIRADALLEITTGKRPKLTLDAAFGRYWLDHAKDLKSAVDITRGTRVILAGIGKHVALGDLSNDIVARFVAKRRGTKSKRKTLLSPASVNRELTLLRAVCRMARDRWGYEVAPINWKGQWLSEPEARETYLTADEAERILAELPKHLRAPFLLSLLTGLRKGNVLGLDWRQINMKARKIRVKIKSKKLGGKPLEIDMTEAVLILLANLGPKDEGPVFLYKGRLFKQPHKAWKRALKRAGMDPDTRWHDLRHTAGSWMVQGGIPLDVVQQNLGHTEISTTQRYAHREGSARKAGYDVLADILFGKTIAVDAKKKGKAE